MSETTIDPNILHDLVQHAANARQAAGDRLASANAALKAADLAAQAATRAAAAAVGDPLALAKAERDAHDHFLFAARVAAICEKQHVEASKAQADAYAEAHRPVHDAGVAIRLAACKRADAAKIELAAAELDFQRGTALVFRAREKGCRATAELDGGVLTTPVHSAAYERSMWGLPA